MSPSACLCETQQVREHAEQILWNGFDESDGTIKSLGLASVATFIPCKSLAQCLANWQLLVITFGDLPVLLDCFT